MPHRIKAYERGQNCTRIRSQDFAESFYSRKHTIKNDQQRNPFFNIKMTQTTSKNYSKRNKE